METSEMLSGMLKRRGIEHEVLLASGCLVYLAREKIAEKWFTVIG